MQPRVGVALEKQAYQEKVIVLEWGILNTQTWGLSAIA